MGSQPILTSTLSPLTFDHRLNLELDTGLDLKLDKMVLVIYTTFNIHLREGPYWVLLMLVIVFDIHEAAQFLILTKYHFYRLTSD